MAVPLTRGAERVTIIRRLDHVALVVSDTRQALEYFSGSLGLQVAHTEDLETPRVRLTYLDVGNTFIQLVEPLDADSEVAHVLRSEGEGVHHLCFGVRDVAAAVEVLSDSVSPRLPLGQGRGRVSGFVGGPVRYGIRVECTEFSFEHDVEDRAGWLPDSVVAAGHYDTADAGLPGAAAGPPGMPLPRGDQG
jgi:methylmalonyl-CoA/ethylmalonyl-CoA epimerase